MDPLCIIKSAKLNQWMHFVVLIALVNIICPYLIDNKNKLRPLHNKRNREQRTENKNFNLSEIMFWNTQFLID